MAAEELGEPFGRNHHGRDLVQRGHRGRPDARGQRGPLAHHVTLAPDGQDLLRGAEALADADLDPPGVDDHHLGGVVARAAQHGAGPEDLLYPGRRERLPFGVGQRVPEAPGGGPLPAHAARSHRDVGDGTCVSCVLQVADRPVRVGSVVPCHG